MRKRLGHPNNEKKFQIMYASSFMQLLKDRRAMWLVVICTIPYLIS